tara:strand:- start:202 stop:789 length:588 start_codon:yes stop_codon:yes gene_type:complete
MLKTIDLKKTINPPPLYFDTDLLTKLIDFKVRFSVFDLISAGDKLGKNKQGYFIQEKGNFQKIKRWWHNESRDKTFKYLDEDFTEFFSYCTRIVNSISIPIVNGIQLKCELVELITSTMQGLYNLKKTYQPDKDIEAEKLKCKIDSIIFTLIDVKQMFTNTNVSINESRNNNTSLSMDIRTKIKDTISKELAGSI